MAGRIELAGWLARKLGVTAGIGVEIIHAETPRALCVTGHALAEPRTHCSRCGRELTHPASRLLGIGPVCGRHYHIPPESLQGPDGSLSEDALAALRALVEAVRIERTWLPKSAIVEMDLAGAVREDRQPAPSASAPTAPPAQPAAMQPATPQPAAATPQPAAATPPDALIDILPNGQATVKPVVRLNGRWDAYKAACDGAGFRSRKNAAGQWEQAADPANLPALIAALKAAGFRVNGTPAAAAALSRAALGAPTNPAGDRAADRAVHLELFPFQVDGARWLANRPAAILSDSMGLGKTVQLLMAI